MNDKCDILIIDDENDLVANLKDIMEKRNYSVEAANNGKIGIDLCYEKIFDVALIDVNLPDISGNDVASKIIEISPETECILVTGYASLESAIEAVKQKGIVAYETKPLNIDRILAFISEILKRKQAEEALHNREILYSALFHHNPIQTVVVDTEGKVIAFNKIKELSGDRLPQIGDMMYKDYASYHKIDMHQELMSCIKSGIMTEFPEQEYGDKVLSIKISPFEAGAIITSQNITRQKMAEKNLLKEKNFSESMINALPGIFSLFTEDGGFIRWNKNFEDVSGYSFREISEMNLLDFIEQNNKTFISESIQQIIQNGSANIETNIIYKDGKRIPYYLTGIRIILDNEPYFINAGIDISELKRIEEALQQSNERYSLLAKNVTDVIWTADIQLHITYVSPSINNLLGYKNDEPVPIKSVDNFLTQESIEYSMSILDEELKKDKSLNVSAQRSRILELEIKVRDGSTIWTETKVTFLRNAEGLPVGLIGVTRDISVRKKLQEQLIHSEKLSAVGQLAAGVAHEFNNLLAVILGHAQLSKEEYSINQIKKSMDVIEKVAKRGRDLVKDLSAFARPKEPQFITQDITEIIDEIIGLQKKQLHLENIEVKTKYINPSSVSFDRGQIEQVFMNLLINASHAIRPKGRGAISISVKNEDSNVRIDFSDTGIGMDDEIKMKIFEPFFSTKGGWAKDSLGISGTGLGLSVTHTIIQQHKGAITVESEKNKGATFTILIPIVESELKKEQIRRNTISNSGIKKISDLRIMIVDDEEDVVNLLKLVLRKTNHKNVVVENSGQNAIKTFKDFKPDVVFLDIIMPDMSGREVFDKMRSMNPGAPVIFMSGKLGLEKEEFITNGAYDFLQKPFDLKKISDILNQIVNKKEGE